MRTMLLGGALALAVAVSAGPLRADLYVLESTTTTINPGSHIATSDRITIPAGSFIRAVLPSGKTQTIKGPFSGSAADLDKGQALNEGVLGWLRSILETGGAKELTPGATRSIKREPPRSATAFSWSAVPVAIDAVVCVPKGGKVELVRTPATRPDHVSIIDAATGARGEAQWEAGEAATAWPASLPPRTDAIYYLLVPDRPQRRLTVRLIESVPPDDDVLVVLQRLGCKPQFDAWVREKLRQSAERR
jgi:hypothetical protein